MHNNLNGYILKQLLRALGFSGLALIGMFWLGQAVPLIEEIISHGESTLTFFRLAIMLIPNITKLLLPVAVLIAVIFSMNRLASEGELMAIHNSGQNPMHLLLPIFGFGLLVFFVHFAVSLWLAPKSLMNMNNQIHEIKENFSNNVIGEKNFISPERGLYVFADKSSQEGEMLDIFIDDRREENLARTYFSKKAILLHKDGRSLLALIDGQYHERNLTTDQISIGTFSRFEVELKTGLSHDIYYPAIEELPYSHLKSEALSPNYSFEEKLGERVDRLAFPFLSLIMPIIGALGFLGAPLSRQGYTPIIIFSTISGLAAEAYIFSMNGFITGHSHMLLVVFLPFILVILALFFFFQKINGPSR